MTVRRNAPFLAPALIAVAGIAWMQCAVSHYRRLTGRGFYSLAGYHYSMPEWGFSYYPGGEAIHRWTTIFPGYVTAATLLFSLIVAIAAARRTGAPPIAKIVAVHILVAVLFTLVATWYEINVTGVFI